MCGLQANKLIIGLLLLSFTSQFSIAEEEKIESERELAVIVKKHFANLANFRTGDLVTAGDVKPLLQELSSEGWDVPESGTLIARLVPSGSYLDRTFSTRKGRKFFREISRVPGGIDRVERMSKLKAGKGSIGQLVNSAPFGSDFIAQMATTKVGRNMGKRAGNTRDGKNFNKPTGKIYTEEALMKELVVRFRTDLSRAKKP